jgi:urease accessory protein
VFDLAPGAELIGWDIAALGLPNANLPFESGQLLQHLEMPGAWLERGRIDAADHRLMTSPLGLHGHKCTASMFFLAGSPLARHRRQQALDVAREVIEQHARQATVGATSPNPQVVVIRALAPLVEPAMQLMQQVWKVWRGQLWDMTEVKPRIWSM